MTYLLFSLSACSLAVIITPLVKRFARKVGAMDIPRPPRNLHTKPTPKLGGLAVYIAFVGALILYLVFGDVNFHIIPLKFFLAIIAGGFILMLEGYLDDKYTLPPKVLWIFPAAAALVIVLSGIGVGIKFLTNPFGAPINLNFALIGIPASGIFVWIWMMGMMFTTKFLDGLDGLVAGISTIAALALFCLSLTARVNQPMTATMAIIFAGALVGYLIYAFQPASIFLGDGGSLYAGFILGTLSIILGGKIATALLVMGIPILDVAWVIVRRLWYRASPFLGDRQHLHFRLLDIGFTQRQTILILYLISAVFGFTAVFLQSVGKLIALIVLVLVMVAIVIGVVIGYKRKQRELTISEDFDRIS